MNCIKKCFKMQSKSDVIKCLFKCIVIIALFIFVSILILNFKIKKDIHLTLENIVISQKHVIEYLIQEERGKSMRNANMISENQKMDKEEYLKYKSLVSSSNIDYILMDKDKNRKNIINKRYEYKYIDLINVDAISSSTVSPIFFDENLNSYIMYVLNFLMGDDKCRENYLISVVNADIFYDTLKKDKKFNKIDFYLIANEEIISSSKKMNKSQAKLSYNILKNNLFGDGDFDLIDVSNEYVNYEGKRVFAYYVDIEDTDWKLIYEQDKKYAFYSRYQKIIGVIISNLVEFVEKSMKFIEQM